MSLTLGLQSSISGLLTSQRGLDVVSHNIANVNTEGYTRKKMNAEARVLAGHGAGVQIASIGRDIDENLRRDIRTETGTWAKLDSLKTYYDRMQDLFGKPSENRTISHTLGTMAQDFETLGTEADKTTNQWAAARAADDVANQLNKMNDELQDLRLLASKDIATLVTKVNEALANIQSLNDKIVRESAAGHEIADLEDQRDMAMATISENLDIQSFTRGDNTIAIYTSGGRTLLDNTSTSISYTSATLVQAWMTKGGGELGEMTVGTNDITSEITNGRLKALIDLRDNVLPNAQAELDELTYQVKNQINLIHNRGTTHPTLMTNATGTRTFIDSSLQTISMTSGDTAITLFDANGAQTATTTLRKLMIDNPANGVADFAYAGPWVIDTVASRLQTWVRANGAAAATVAVNTDDHLEIDLNSSSLSLTMRDQAADTWETLRSTSSTTALGVAGTLTIWDSTTAAAGAPLGTLTVAATATIQDIYDTLTTGVATGGVTATTIAAAAVTANIETSGGGVRLSLASPTAGRELAFTDTGNLFSELGLHGAAQDATLSFDMNGDATNDQTGLKGFSNFFGLNDLFVLGRKNDLWDSNIQASNFQASLGAAETITFRDSTGALGSVTINNGDTLTNIADRINLAVTNGTITDIQADVVPEGTGYRLRLFHTEGEELVVTQAAGTFLSDIGMAVSACRISGDIELRSDIRSAPALISRGATQFNEDTGTYFLSSGDNTTALDLAEGMTSSFTFRTAGNVAGQSFTLKSYSTTVVSNKAADADHNGNNLKYQADLKDSLEFKNAEISGVNLDEEMAQMIIFQQAYTAAAKVISTTQQLFEILGNIVR
jgi:flagellar hook-associated protein 1 FlgK